MTDFDLAQVENDILVQLPIDYSMVQVLVYEMRRLRAGLQRIVDHEGSVCKNFQTCEHASCCSSYRSWQIAEQLLRE